MYVLQIDRKGITDIVNWYIINDGQTLCGDLCIIKGNRYNGYLEDKRKYRSHKDIRKKDKSNDTREFQYIQCKIISVYEDNGDTIVDTSIYGAIRLINMDAYFYLSESRRVEQQNVLIKLSQEYKCQDNHASTFHLK